jgi:hypothetical protein
LTLLLVEGADGLSNGAFEGSCSCLLCVIQQRDIRIRRGTYTYFSDGLTRYLHSCIPWFFSQPFTLFVFETRNLGKKLRYNLSQLFLLDGRRQAMRSMMKNWKNSLFAQKLTKKLDSESRKNRISETVEKQTFSVMSLFVICGIP